MKKILIKEYVESSGKDSTNDEALRFELLTPEEKPDMNKKYASKILLMLVLCDRTADAEILLKSS